MDFRTEIIQYNCGRTNHQKARPLFDSFETPLVIAVQEPAYDKKTGRTYCPRPYELAYEAGPTTRVTFIVKRTLGIDR